MPFIEEIFKNKGGKFGAHTGKQYEASEIETIGGIEWSKPTHYAPNTVNVEIEADDVLNAEEPHENLEQEAHEIVPLKRR